MALARFFVAVNNAILHVMPHWVAAFRQPPYWKYRLWKVLSIIFFFCYVVAIVVEEFPTQLWNAAKAEKDTDEMVSLLIAYIGTALVTPFVSTLFTAIFFIVSLHFLQEYRRLRFPAKFLTAIVHEIIVEASQGSWTRQVLFVSLTCSYICFFRAMVVRGEKGILKTIMSQFARTSYRYWKDHDYKMAGIFFIPTLLVALGLLIGNIGRNPNHDPDWYDGMKVEDD